MPSSKDVIRNTIASADMILNAYLGDLSDDDLFAPQFEGGNPIAWQLGHLISVERSWVEGLKAGSCPELPEGFAAAHTKETAVPNAMPRTSWR